MQKVISVTITNSNVNVKPETISTNELTELNEYLENGWTIIDSKVVTLETAGLYFTVIYTLGK